MTTLPPALAIAGLEGSAENLPLKVSDPASPWGPRYPAGSLAESMMRPKPSIVPAKPPGGDSTSSDAGGAMASDSHVLAWDATTGAPVKRSGSLYTGSLPTGGGGEVGHWKGTGRQVNAIDQPFVTPGAGEKSFGSAMGTTADLMGRASTRAMLDAAFGTDQQLRAPDYSEQMERSYAGDAAMNKARLAASMSEIVPQGTEIAPPPPEPPGTLLPPPGTPKRKGMTTPVPMSRQQVLDLVQGIATNPTLMREGAVGPYLAEITRRQAEIDTLKRLSRGLVSDGKGNYRVQPIDPKVADAYRQYAAELEDSRNQYLKSAQVAGGAAAGRSIAGGNLERDLPVEGGGFPAMAGGAGR